MPPFREFAAHSWVQRRRALFAFGAVFLPLLLVAALVPPRYRATATLAILPSPEFTVRPDAGSKDLNASALAMDQIMKAETEILASDDLHEAVLRTVGLGTLYPDLASSQAPGWAGAALGWLLRPWTGAVAVGPEARLSRALERMGDRLNVHATKDGNVIELGFDDRDPVMAARVLNALLATYATRRSRLYDDPQARIVRSEAAAAAQAAADADQRLAAYKAVHEIANFNQQRDLLLKRLSDAQGALADANSAEAEQRARAGSLESAIRHTPPAIGFYRERDPDERLQTVDDGLVELRGRLAAVLVHYRETSRMVGDLRRQIAARQAERERLASDGSPSVLRSGRPPALDLLEVDHARALAEAAGDSSRGRVLEATVASLRDGIGRLETAEEALRGLERQRDMRDEALRSATRVLAERRLVEAEDASRLANVRVIQPARVPQRPTLLKLLIVLGGVLLGLMAAVAGLLWGFVARPSFLTAEGLAEATGLPVLGVFREMAEPAVT